jgi:hypothetical protein
MGNALDGIPVTLESLAAAMNSPIGDELCKYFHHYPTGSIMVDKSRAMLFVLVRMLRPVSSVPLSLTTRQGRRRIGAQRQFERRIESHIH